MWPVDLNDASMAGVVAVIGERGIGKNGFLRQVAAAQRVLVDAADRRQSRVRRDGVLPSIGQHRRDAGLARVDRQGGVACHPVDHPAKRIVAQIPVAVGPADI